MQFAEGEEWVVLGLKTWLSIAFDTKYATTSSKGILETSKEAQDKRNRFESNQTRAILLYLKSFET